MAENTTVANDPPPSEVGQPESHKEVRERYRVLHPHAKGGLGEVFVAQDAELHRQVALKFLKPQFKSDSGACARFLLEAEITARLEHPGVVPVYGLVPQPDGTNAYAMRFIEGETLKDAIERLHLPQTSPEPTGEAAGKLKGILGTIWNGWVFFVAINFLVFLPRRLSRDPRGYRLVLRQLLNRFVVVCNTVAYAHSRGIIHRDIKPANIMLGRFGETLLVDWGLAKRVQRVETRVSTGEDSLVPQIAPPGELTRMGEAAGTPQFMSPEQAAGRWDNVGPASDIYSLGATLYVLLTGGLPFQAKAISNLLDDVQQGKFPRPRERRRGISRALEAICLKAMAIRPEDRYASALDLATDIERWLADEPISAWRRPWVGRVYHWLTRSRESIGLVKTLYSLWSGVAMLFASVLLAILLLLLAHLIKALTR
jgi:serine/threonine protein kinase